MSKEERNKKIVEARKLGLSYVEIGKRFCVTPDYAGLIVWQEVFSGRVSPEEVKYKGRALP